LKSENCEILLNFALKQERLLSEPLSMEIQA